jgi:hypothetical protein
MEDMGRKYWKKRSYIFQGFVTQSDLQEDSVPENPIRRFVISPQIYKIISSALMDPEFQEIPTDYEAGTDFVIKKSTKGQYADYSTSNWARRERSLDQTERDAIATHDLHNLNDFLPKKPDAEHLNAIFEMFEASVDGQLYDPERFGQYYRPYGIDAPATTGAKPVAAATTPPPTPAPAPAPAAPVVEQAPAPAPAAPAVDMTPEPEMATAAAATAPEGGQPSAQDILAQIRNRKQ